MQDTNTTVDMALRHSLAGFCAAHSELVVAGENMQFIARRKLVPGKPGLVSGGGSGLEPMHIGFVGHGMLDAACPGPVFAAPTPEQVLAAIHAVETGGGTLLIVPNFAADVDSFGAGGALAQGDVETVIVDDGVAPAKFIEPAQSRCVGGIAIVEKIVGAAAERGMALADLAALGHRVNARTRSLGASLQGAAGQAANVQDIVALTVKTLLASLPLASNQPWLMLINGFGGTPLMQLYLCSHFARRSLHAQRIDIVRSLVGSYGSSRDRTGFSLTLCALDAQMHDLWAAPLATPAWRWGM